MSEMSKLKDLTNEAMTRCPGVTEATMRQRLKKCNFNVDLACDSGHWLKNRTRKRNDLILRGKHYSITGFAKILGVSKSLVSRWLARGYKADRIAKGIMYGEIGPNIYQHLVDPGTPPDWSELERDAGPRVKLEDLSRFDPTAYDLAYGTGPVNEI